MDNCPTCHGEDWKLITDEPIDIYWCQECGTIEYEGGERDIPKKLIGLSRTNSENFIPDCEL